MTGLRSDRSAVAQSEQPTPPQPASKTDAAAARCLGEYGHESPVSRRPWQPSRNQTNDQAVRARQSAPASEDQAQGERDTAGRVPMQRRPGASAKESASASADPLAADPFWNRPEMLRNWDVATLSAADEQKLGAQLHDVIVSLNPVAADGPWQQRLEEAAKPFLATLTRKEISYHFRGHGEPAGQRVLAPGRLRLRESRAV